MNIELSHTNTLTLVDALARAPRAVTCRLIDSDHATLTCYDRIAQITRVDGGWQASREVNGNRIAPRETLSSRADARRLLHWVAGPHCVDADDELRRIEVGMYVEVDDAEGYDAEGYDRGEVIAVDDEKVTVAWEGAACKLRSPYAALDGLVIHELCVHVPWRHEWSGDEAEDLARELDEAAWREDRGC
jgi:hypothetical protein